MARWIALLRAVNVGGRKFPMAELRQVLADAGYADVETHIQTGNVALSSPRKSQAVLESELERLLTADRGFSVDVIALTPAELSRIVADLDEVGPAAYGHYVSVLSTEPTAEQRAELERPRYEHERVVVRGRGVHLLYGVPYHEAKFSNLGVEKITGGAATNRNDRVLRAMAAKWGVQA